MDVVCAKIATVQSPKHANMLAMKCTAKQGGLLCFNILLNITNISSQNALFEV